MFFLQRRIRYWSKIYDSWKVTLLPVFLENSEPKTGQEHKFWLFRNREHTDLESSTESIPIRVDRIFFDPLMNRYSDSSTISHLLSSHVDQRCPCCLQTINTPVAAAIWQDFQATRWPLTRRGVAAGGVSKAIHCIPNNGRRLPIEVRCLLKR